MSQNTQVKQSEQKQKVNQVHKSDSQRAVTDYFKGNKSAEDTDDLFVEVSSEKKEMKWKTYHWG